MNCENHQSLLTTNIKKIQIPKLLNKKKNKTKNEDELWKQLREIIEVSIEDDSQKAKALEIIEILQNPQENKNIVKSVPLTEEKLSDDSKSNFNETINQCGGECSTTITSFTDISSDLFTSKVPMVSERAKRRHRRASLIAAFESPTKVPKQTDSKREIHESPEPNPTPCCVEEHDLNLDLPEDVASGLVHWDPETSENAVQITFSEGEVISSTEHAISISICEEQIEKLSLAARLDVEENKEKNTLKKGRRGRRKSVCAAKARLTRKNSDSPRSSEEGSKSLQDVREPASVDTLESSEFDEFNAGFLHWAGDDVAVTGSSSGCEGSQELCEEKSEVKDITRSKRRQRRASVSKGLESPQKIRTPRLTQLASTPQKGTVQELHVVTPKKDGIMLPNSMNTDCNSADSVNCRILNILPSEFSYVINLLKIHQPVGYSPGEILLSGCLASYATDKNRTTITSCLQYFIPLCRTFSKLSIHNSIFSSQDSQKTRKIRFGDNYGGGCISPPNDRKPGSCQNFRQNSKLYGAIIASIEEILYIEKNSPELKNLMNYIREELSQIANSIKAAIHIAETYAKCQNIPMNSFYLPLPHELLKMSALLRAELNHSDTLNDFEKPRSNPLYFPQNRFARTALRYQSTWTTVSIIRYHLRWLFDEPPLRAEKVQLMGDSPMLSTRSMLTQAVSINPIQQATNRAELMDISTSSALTLALQQIYNGLGAWFASEEMLPTVNCDLFYETLSYARLQFQQKIISMFTGESLTQVEMLQFAQIAFAAEKGRQFVHTLLTNKSVETIGRTSGVWSVVEEESKIILRHGMEEDYYFSLLSSIPSLTQIVAKSFVPDQFIRPLEKIVFQKLSGKANKLMTDKSELKELMELCPYLFRFPSIDNRSDDP